MCAHARMHVRTHTYTHTKCEESTQNSDIGLSDFKITYFNATLNTVSISSYWEMYHLLR